MKSVYLALFYFSMSLSANEPQLKNYIILSTLYGKAEVQNYLRKHSAFYIGRYNEEEQKFVIEFYKHKELRNFKGYKVFLPAYYKDENEEIGIFLARKRKNGPIDPALLKLLSKVENPF